MPPFRILILHAGALGDCVLAIHLARTMNAVPPLVSGDGRPVSVTIAARSAIIHWAARSGLIDQAINLDAIAPSLWRSHGAAPTDDWLAFLNSFDWVISFLGGPADPVSVNLGRDCRNELRCIDPRATTTGPPRHIVDQWLDQLGSAFRPATQGQAPIVPSDPQARTELTRRSRQDNQPVILIHPGSGGKSKCCDLEALERLVPLLEQNGFTPAWIIGPDEKERFGDGYAERLASTAPLIFEVSVEAAADLVAAADAYIGMDAGMTHVAALAGVNTVALFGPTDPAVWRPLGRSAHILPFPTDSPPAAWLKKIERCVLPG